MKEIIKAVFVKWSVSWGGSLWISVIMLSFLLFSSGCKKDGPPEVTGLSPVGIPGNWKLVFADEFNGTSLNLKDWTPNWKNPWNSDPTTVGITVPVWHGGTNEEWAVYDPACVRVSDGNLRLSLVSSPIKFAGTDYEYRSGMIQTENKHWFTYGAFEARIYLTEYKEGLIANWPSFWVTGDGSGGTWPLNGELDIMEGIDGYAHYAFHSVDPEDWKDPEKGNFVTGNYTGWHTFAANWQKDAIRYYYDGKLVGIVAKQITSSPMYLILCQAIGGSAGKKTFKANTTMLVDYLRVWQ